MRHSPLKRLSSQEYMSVHQSIQIYRQVLTSAFETHWHDFSEMGFVLSGRGEHILNGQRQPLQRGSLFLLTPADFHQIVPQPGNQLTLFNVVFQAEMLKEEIYRWLFQDLTSYQVSFSPTEADEIEREFACLQAESQTGHIGSHLMIIGALERILIKLYRASLPLAGKPSLEGREAHFQQLGMSLIYMHHHFRRPLSLEEVAGQVHLSPAYFSECFHRVYGISFQRYLQDLRLQFASSLLSAAQLPVSHICTASGFQTLSHFERSFKQKFGLSPRQFARRRPAGPDLRAGYQDEV